MRKVTLPEGLSIKQAAPVLVSHALSNHREMVTTTLNGVPLEVRSTMSAAEIEHQYSIRFSATLL